MKNIKFVIVFLVTILFVSCNITEKIIINSDGTGKVSYNFNMSKFIETVSKMGSKEKESAKAIFSESDKDVDSIFHFKDFKELAIKRGDTLTDDQIAMFEKMKNFSVHTVVNKKEGQVYYELYGTFSNITELNGMDAPASIVQKSTGKKAEAMPGMVGLFNDTKTTMTFKGNTFSRLVEKKEVVVDTAFQFEEEYVEEEDSLAESVNYIEDSTYVYNDYADSTMVDTAAVDVDYSEEYGEDEEEEISKADLKKMSKEFKQVGKIMEKGFKDSKYIIEYSFPRKIKSVSIKNHKLSKDKKTVFIIYSIEEYMKAPEKLSFTIELENE